MTIRTPIATLAAAVAAGAAASTVGATDAALKNCGTVRAGGWAFHVAVARVDCASARALTKKLAGKGLPAKPTLYPGTYLNMRCFGVAVKAQGAQIQCTGDNGRRSIYSIATR